MSYYYASRTPLKPGVKIRPLKSDHAKQDIEDVFERVRAEQFPHRPPRMGSVFVCPDRTGFCSGSAMIGRKHVYEVEIRGAAKTFTANAEMWTEAAFKPHQAESYAESYWKRDIKDKSGYFFREVLVHGGSVVVVQEVSMGESLAEGTSEHGFMGYHIVLSPKGKSTRFIVTAPDGWTATGREPKNERLTLAVVKRIILRRANTMESLVESIDRLIEAKELWTVEAFFKRHPKLKKYSPKKIETPERQGSRGNHPEASQEGDKILLYPKFFKLSPKTMDFVFAHEVGHFWASPWSHWGKSNSLSGFIQSQGLSVWEDLPYAQGNYEEAFADCFAEYFLSPSELKSRYPKWYELVKSMT